jgi:hypothetical protein
MFATIFSLSHSSLLSTKAVSDFLPMLPEITEVLSLEVLGIQEETEPSSNSFHISRELPPSAPPDSRPAGALLLALLTWTVSAVSARRATTKMATVCNVGATRILCHQPKLIAGLIARGIVLDHKYWWPVSQMSVQRILATTPDPHQPFMQ